MSNTDSKSKQIDLSKPILNHQATEHLKAYAKRVNPNNARFPFSVKDHKESMLLMNRLMWNDFMRFMRRTL